MKNQSYLIKCITNMHVGNGDVNFGVIDNEVQRDPVTGFPCIYSSSVKGALRDYFDENAYGQIEEIFGSDAKKSNDNRGEGSKKGLIKFMQADILFLPVRAIAGNQAYYMATCKQALEDFGRHCNMIKGKTTNGKYDDLVKEIDSEKRYAQANDQKMRIGAFSDNSVKNPELADIICEKFGIEKEKLVIVPDKEYSKITIPVLARNNLAVQNLFYEEVVPHESVFYFTVLSTGTNKADEALDSFAGSMGNSSLVQLGGNASIGYGLCEIKKLA